ncbi:protein DD3-3-like [Patiria miniata]|uniref:Protein DD3-3 n=1 Tax=Patiria miniata TaxID=46514 RepID=A0A913ZS60_PATMI|nr:protein DD3-3-like [Patiria miniata]
MKLVVLIPLLLCVMGVYCDMYLHNPRGSNNRLDEAKRERNNGNRLFDSQNNNRGGYNVGSLAYMAGSVLQIEWTNQHSCSDPNSNCEIILQYMCGDLVRDGSTTSTIPEWPSNCAEYDCNQDIEYGMHEPYDHYLNCKLRQRQANLFTADQNLKGNSAKYTRQNPGGTRRGYECPEERDYYPYWGPSPWRDVAILTNDATRCPYYQAESANVKARYACTLPREMIEENMSSRQPIIPITKEECEAIVYPADAQDGTGTRGVWAEVAAHGIAAPDCRESHWSRDNHLGNGIYGQTLSYNWTIPNIDHERCVMRIRYNISTGEYNGWSGNVNASLNKQGNQESTLDVATKYGFANLEAGDDRGYVFENNPEVDVFGNVEGTNNKNFELRLAINTAQLGRTFQDRSHTFAIRKRPADVPATATIRNLNVRGKRGNIVQVYPGVEYDFVPNTIETVPGEYIHIQWTGSNTNPNNNDGQGLPGTDRSNIVMLESPAYAEGGLSYYAPYTKNGQLGRNYPLNLDETTFLGFSRADLQDMAVLSSHQFRGEMSELDDAGTFYDAKPLAVTMTGHYHYMCTRNNNFSNRSQKGRIISKSEPVAYTSIGWTGGQVESQTGVLAFTQGTLDHLEDIKMEEWSPERGHEAVTAKGGADNLPGTYYETNFVVITPVEKFTVGDRKFEVRIKLLESNTDMIGVYRSDPDNLVNWVRMDAKTEGQELVFSVDQGGAYVARGTVSGGFVAGVVIALVVLVVIVGGSVFYFRKNPDKWESMTSSCRGAGGRV